MSFSDFLFGKENEVALEETKKQSQEDEVFLSLDGVKKDIRKAREQFLMDCSEKLLKGGKDNKLAIDFTKYFIGVANESLAPLLDAMFRLGYKCGQDDKGRIVESSSQSDLEKISDEVKKLRLELAEAKKEKGKKSIKASKETFSERKEGKKKASPAKKKSKPEYVLLDSKGRFQRDLEEELSEEDIEDLKDVGLNIGIRTKGGKYIKI